MTKIQKIKAWYTNREQELPKHISIVIEKIESTASYEALCQLKTSSADPAVIAESYVQFLENYFNEDFERALINTLQLEFIRSFQT